MHRMLFLLPLSLSLSLSLSHPNPSLSELLGQLSLLTESVQCLLAAVLGPAHAQDALLRELESLLLHTHDGGAESSELPQHKAALTGRNRIRRQTLEPLLKDTPLYRALHWVPKVSTIEGGLLYLH